MVCVILQNGVRNANVQALPIAPNTIMEVEDAGGRGTKRPRVQPHALQVTLVMVRLGRNRLWICVV